MRLVLKQYREKVEGGPQGIETTFWMPPNLSGDMLRWIVQERGPARATWYVVDTIRIMREAQELLDLPQTTAALVVPGMCPDGRQPGPVHP